VPTVDAFIRRGAVLGRGEVAAPAASVAAAVARLIEDGRLRARLAAAGPQLVDGRGTRRVAAVVRRMALRQKKGTPCGQ
jgi:hypothetical protein